MEVSIISAAPSCIFLIGSFSVVGLLVRGRLGFCCVFTTDSSVMKLQFTNINITGGFPSFPSGSAVKNPPAALETQETRVQSLDQEDTLEEQMATHSQYFLPRKYHGQRSLASLQFIGSQRVRQDLETEHTHKY